MGHPSCTRRFCYGCCWHPFSSPASRCCHRPRRQFSASGMTHIMLGFEFAGGWKDIKGSVAVTALQFLMGGGGSFSAGGPGARTCFTLHTPCQGVQLTAGWAGTLSEPDGIHASASVGAAASLPEPPGGGRL